MQRIAKSLDILVPPQTIDVPNSFGTCAIAKTTDPFVMPPTGTACFAILADWFPNEAPVAMLVTYRQYVPESADPDQAEREVGTVYADAAFRGHPDQQGRTLPVLIGKWMFQARLLTLHSADRTSSGDRWAQLVGGRCPPRNQKGTPEATVQSGSDALVRLNVENWPPAPWPLA